MKGHGTKIIKLVSTSGRGSSDGTTAGKIGRICYVDDSRTSAYVTKKILKEYGYEVDFFPAAEPAVVSILENDYDLLLTDLTLSTGGMDGDELVRFLRNSGHPRKKLLPVIVITGTSDKETLLKIYEAGANGVLVKPITGEELHDRIRTLVPEKSYPGTADGYALEIPQTMQTPGSDAQHQEDESSESLLSSLGIDAGTIDAASEAHSAPSQQPPQAEKAHKQPAKNRARKAEVNTEASVKKASPARNKQSAAKSTANADVAAPAAGKANRAEENPKDKKLSILENLKLAAFGNDDLDLDFDDDDFPDFANTGNELQEEPVSRQHTTPVYKNNQAAGEAGSPEKEKARPKPKSQGAEFIAELRAQAKADAEASAQARTGQKTQAASDANLDDDIPVLEPASGDELLFTMDEPSAPPPTPELKLEDSELKLEGGPEQAKQAQPEQPQKKQAEPEMEEIMGDKRIITALDINTDFSEFDDEIFEPSMSQSLVDTLRNYKLLSGAAILSVGIILWSLMSYFNVGEVHEVEVSRIVKGTLHQTINVPGKVVSKLQINVSSSSSGQIVSVLVKEGQKVTKGQALVKLENEEAISDVKRAEGNLLSAKEETALANKTLKRMRRALKLGAISRQQMEEAEASLKSAQAKENVALEARRTAQLSLDKLNVSAPFTGTVTSRFAQVGQWITPSDTLFTLVDLGQREVEVKVDSADSNSLSVGQSVFMSSDAFAGQDWTETVSRIAPATSKGDGTNTVSVYISMGPGSPPLRLGQQVDAEIRTFSRKNTMKLPINAVISRNGKAWIGTINDGRVHFVPVETGMEDLTHVEIVQGARVNQEVIIPGGKEIQEGDRVRIARAASPE